MTRGLIRVLQYYISICQSLNVSKFDCDNWIDAGGRLMYHIRKDFLYCGVELETDRRCWWYAGLFLGSWLIRRLYY